MPINYDVEYPELQRKLNGAVEIINDAPCYFQWFWTDGESITCVNEGRAHEDYCPACKAKAGII